MKLPEDYNKPIRWDITHSYESYPNKHLILKKEYKEILTYFFLTLLKEIVETGICFKLPHRTGIIGIKKVKRVGNLVNWVLSRETNSLIRRNLFASEGMQARLFWNKKSTQGNDITFSNIWGIRSTEFAKKYICNQVLHNNTINKYYNNG